LQLVIALVSAHNHDVNDAGEQALRLDYSLARTSQARTQGLEAWYAAELAEAEIIPRSDAETEAALARLDAVHAQANRRRGNLGEGETPDEPTERKRIIALVHDIAER
jgi:hypothetical protein